jgi:hypothetical protein
VGNKNLFFMKKAREFLGSQIKPGVFFSEKKKQKGKVHLLLTTLEGLALENLPASSFVLRGCK